MIYAAQVFVPSDGQLPAQGVEVIFWRNGISSLGEFDSELDAWYDPFGGLVGEREDVDLWMALPDKDSLDDMLGTTKEEREGWFQRDKADSALRPRPQQPKRKRALDLEE